MASNDVVINGLPHTTLTVRVRITRGFRIRMRLALVLIWLAAKLVGSRFQVIREGGDDGAH